MRDREASGQLYRWLSAAVLWTIAISLVGVQTFCDVKGYAVIGWSFLAGLAACVFTGWALLVLERLRNEHIASLVCSYNEQYNKVTSLR